MILQALDGYYRRLAAEKRGVADKGFAPQNIGFALEINEQGQLLAVHDLREQAAKGKKLAPRKMDVPSLGKGRTVGIEPNFLWDGPGYVLGRDDKGKPGRTAQCREAFRKLHEDLLNGLDAPEAKALLLFLRNPPANHPEVEQYWADMASANLVFRMGHVFLHEIPALKNAWSKRGQEDGETEEGICLVTGERTLIAKLHTPIKGVIGAQSSGAALCSYNLSSFESFGKKQNLNGPISKAAAFGYTTALNYLLACPAQRLRLGQATAVCWALAPTRLEENFFSFLTDPAPAGEMTIDTASASERAGILRKLGQGLPVAQAWPQLEAGVHMYVLALAPNAARLSVSFFLQGEAGKFLERIAVYYKHLSITRRFDTEPEFPNVWQIARAVLGPHKELKDINRLGEDLIRVALSGGLYPSYLLPLCLQRLRCGDDLSAVRAGLIKAMLIRNYRHQEELMSLNPTHPSPAYQLGRLFALLAGVQRKAIGQNINADIRDKYYGSASATPSLVFPLLLRGAQNHISKARAFKYDALIRDVLNTIDNAFPAHLNLEGQGLFALGYYHQRADKFVASDEDVTVGDTTAAAQEQQ